MNTMLNDISTVKIYFRYGQKTKVQSFWQRLWNNNLGQLLLKKAKELNIKQAAIFTAKSGYLQGDNISSNISEIPSSKNPVCLELVDSSEKLQTFLADNKTLLEDTNVILLSNNNLQLTSAKL